MNPSHHYTLSFSCPDRVGIVARVTGFFAEHGGWILSSSQHADADSDRYFMRLEVRADSLPFDRAELQRQLLMLRHRRPEAQRPQQAAVDLHAIQGA